MKCIKCGNETNKGAIFKFYYGKRGGTEQISRRATLTRYQMAGSEDAYLCDGCVDQHIEKRARWMGGGVFLSILILSILRLTLGGPAPQGSELETVIGFPTALVAGIFLYYGIRRWKKNKQRVFMGDNLAIKTRKPILKRSGYDSFFTRDEFARLT